MWTNNKIKPSSHSVAAGFVDKRLWTIVQVIVHMEAWQDQKTQSHALSNELISNMKIWSWTGKFQEKWKQFDDHFL